MQTRTVPHLQLNSVAQEHSRRRVSRGEYFSVEKARVISAVQSQSRLFHSRWKGYQNYWHCSYYFWMQIHSSLEKILHTDRSDSITAYVSYQIKWGYLSLLDIITCWASANHIHYLGCEEAKTQRKKHLKLNVLFFFLSCLIKLLFIKKNVYLLNTFNTLLSHLNVRILELVEFWCHAICKMSLYLFWAFPLAI